jgi:hypothetical protein
MSFFAEAWRTFKRSVLLIPEPGPVLPLTPRSPLQADATTQAPAPPTPFSAPAGRAVSKSRTNTAERAAEAVRANPAINSTELAAHLGVSSSYARRLLRKVRESTDAPAGPVACSMPLFPASMTMEVLHGRLTEAERALEIMRSTPPALRNDWNLNRRSQVLRCHSQGLKPEQIASELQLPSGEVKFILKVAAIAAES